MLTANRIRPYTVPWRLFEQVHEDFNREFSNFFGSATPHDPSVGVWTKDDSALVAMELPGRELGDIDVTVDRNGLKIEANGAAEEAVEAASFLRRERSRQQVQRRFQFPFEVDPQSVLATYERGLLVIRLSAHESTQPAKIEVKAG